MPKFTPLKKISYIGIILLVFLCACRKPEQYPIIPEIKFINFEKYQEYSIVNADTQFIDGGILTFYFQDGDGDIGLNDMDLKYPPFNTLPYRNNFFCDYYEKRNGIFEKIDSIETPTGIQPLSLNASIPRLSYLPEESISGEVYMNMPNYRDPSSVYDTIRLEFYIVDRKIHKSNTQEVIVIR